MKKILILTVLLSVGLFSSCSDDNDRFGVDSQSGWVQFQNSSSINVLFNQGGTVSIPVVLNSPVNTLGLEVDYTITDIVGSTAGFISSNGKVSFDQTSNTSNLILTMASGTSLPDSIEFDVVLKETSRSNVSVGIVDGSANLKPIVKRIKICSNQFSTSYVGASTATIDGAPTYDGWVPAITAVPGSDNVFQFDTLWGSGLVPLLSGNPANVFLYPGYLTINDDNTVTIVGINAPTSPNRYPGGTGTYDPCSKVLRYRLNQGLFTNPFQVDVVLIPN